MEDEKKETRQVSQKLHENCAQMVVHSFQFSPRLYDRIVNLVSKIDHSKISTPYFILIRVKNKLYTTKNSWYQPPNRVAFSGSFI